MKPTWIKKDIIVPSNDFEREAVRHVQRVLRCEITGKMDEVTISKIRGLQMLFGLRVTGALDISTAEQVDRIINRYTLD